MQELLEWINSHKSELILLNVSHITGDSHNYVLDASQKLVLQNVTSDQQLIKIILSEPGNTASPTKITLTAPTNAQIDIKEQTLTITYTATDSKIKLDLTSQAPPKIHVSASLPTDKASVKEVKGPEGDLKKITIHLPADTIDETLLNTTKEVLHKLLTDWQTISVAKRAAGQLTIMYPRLKVEDVALVYLPGDSFFQLAAKDGKELVTIDIPLDIFVNIERKSMSFTFDGISYEIVKIA